MIGDATTPTSGCGCYGSGTGGGGGVKPCAITTSATTPGDDVTLPPLLSPQGPMALEVQVRGVN